MTPLELRTKLIRQGYVPLPDSGKACYLDGWPDIKVTRTLIKGWKNDNTAIRGDDLAIVDFDIDDPDLAEEAAAVLLEVLGPTPVSRCRAGSPRFAAFYRRKVPWGKLQTGRYVGASVEIMCDRGKITCFGQHSSGTPYLWAGESPLGVKQSELPLVGVEALTELILRLDALFEARGLSKANGAGGQRGGTFTNLYDLTWDSPIAIEVRGERVECKLSDLVANAASDADRRVTSVACLFARPDAMSYHPLTWDEQGLPVIQDWNWWVMHRLDVDAMLCDSLPMEEVQRLRAPFFSGGSLLAASSTRSKLQERMDHLKSERAKHHYTDGPADSVVVSNPPLLTTIEVVAFRALMETAIPPIPWLVGEVLALGNVTGIAAPPNVGKTRLLISLALAVASGDSVYVGLPIHKRGGCLVVTNEERVEDLHRRLKATVEARGKVPRSKIKIRGADLGALRLVQRNSQGDLVIVEEVLVWLVEQSKGCLLILLDPFITLADNPDENSADMMLVMQALRDLAARSGCAVCFMHHTPKDRSKPDNWYRGSLDAFRGHGSIAGAMDMGYTLARVRSDKEKDGDGPRLPEADRRRWLVLEPAKIREGLHTLDLVLFLESHTLAQEQYDVGVIQPSSIEDLRRAEHAYADEQLVESDEITKARQLFAETMQAPGFYSIRQVKLKMMKVKGWRYTSLNKKHDDHIKYLLKQNIEHDGVRLVLRSHPKIGVTVKCL